jgi:hypothetical protein
MFLGRCSHRLRRWRAEDRILQPRENRGPFGGRQIARHRHRVRIVHRQAENERENVRVGHDRVVIRQIDELLHQRIKISVLREDRLHIGVPGGLHDVERIPDQDADEVGGIDP